MKIVLTEVYSPQTKIANVKALRYAKPGMSLREAKDAVEAVQDGQRLALDVVDPSPLVGYIAYEMTERCGFPSKYDSSFKCNNPLPCRNPDHRGRRVYVARVTEAGSNTVYSRVLREDEDGQSARRAAMQEAIDGGSVVDGEYVVAVPAFACLNASRFTVERVEQPEYRIV